MNRDVPGLVLMLEMVKHGQPRLIGQTDIKHDRVGLVIARDIDGFMRSPGDDALEAQLVRQIAHDRSKGGIVLDHQQQPLGGIKCVAIILDPGRARIGRGTALGRLRAGDRCLRRGPRLFAHGNLGRIVRRRNGQHEPAARADLAFHRDRAAK